MLDVERLFRRHAGKSAKVSRTGWEMAGIRTKKWPERGAIGARAGV